MALGSMNLLLVHALLQLIHQRTVLAMHAQNAANTLELLQHLERLGIVQAQMIVGKVGLKRRHARLANGRKIGAIALVPLGECHMKSVVSRAGSIGTPVPLGKGIGHGHAAIGRRVVHDGRRTAAGSRTRTGLKAIGRPIHASPALHVRVAVDKAGEHPTVGGVLDGIALGRLNRRGDPHDLIAIHGKIGAAKPLGRHERAVFDDDHNCSLLIDAVCHVIKIRAGGDMLRYAPLSLGGIDIPQLVRTRLDQRNVDATFEDRTAAVLALKTHKCIEQFRRKEHRTRRLTVARKTHRVLAATLVKRANHGLKRIRAHKRLVARQKEATFPVAFDSPRKARTDAFAAQLAIVQHARAMLVLANLGDLGPTRRNHNVKVPGNRIDSPGNQRLAIDIGKHLVGAKPLALARSHNDATEFHLRKPPLAALDTIVAIPTIPSSHSVGTGMCSFFQRPSLGSP